MIDATPCLLVIDDNSIDLEHVCALLAAARFHPVCVTSGAAGMALAQCAPVDLILCDIFMPPMDGFEVVKRLKADEVLRKIPILALTAMADSPEELISRGFDGLIAKPVNGENLIAQVKKFLAGETEEKIL